MNRPPACSVVLGEPPLDCDLSPTSNLAVVSRVDGSVHQYKYEVDGKDDEEQGLLYRSEHLGPVLQASTSSRCRAVRFSREGNSLAVGTSAGDVQLVDLATGKVRAAWPGAHPDSISCLHALPGDLTAAGDETGIVRWWEERQPKPVYSYRKHKDYISDMALNERCSSLVCVSGDGTLSVHELTKRSCRARSEEDADDELLSVVVLKNGKKVVCGTQSGVIQLYSWGYFNDCSDRFPGHPESVDAVVKYDEDTVITGSCDGGIRLVNILPNKLIGVVGAHVDLPIEGLRLAHDRQVLVSRSHDATLNLWDLSYLRSDESDEDKGQEEEERDGSSGVLVSENDQEDDISISDAGKSDKSDDDSDDNSDDAQGHDSDGEDEHVEDDNSEEEDVSGSDNSSDGPLSDNPDQQQEATGADGSGSDLPRPLLDGDKDTPGRHRGSDEDDDSSDDSQGGRKKKKRQKREKTKWPRKPPGTTSNFFDGLL